MKEVLCCGARGREFDTFPSCLLFFSGFLSPPGTNGVGVKVPANGRGATLHLIRKRLIGVSPHFLPKRTESHFFLFLGV